MSKKLAEKSALIGMLSIAPANKQDQNAAAKPRTAPGQMAQFLNSQSGLQQEAAELREKLKELEGAAGIRQIDPKEIAPSKWANRHADNFEGPEFAALRAEIEAAGGNVQPIKVRPLNGSTPGHGRAAYEVVYGHRRHRACLDLGIKVNAVVENLDDVELFEQMERENRARKNLSAWEQGVMYLKALDEGLYPSQRKLSEAINVDLSLISKSVALARLPAAVIDAFPSPLEIQFRWAQPLSEAIQKDPDGVLKRAKQIKAEGEAQTSAQVLNRLLGIAKPAGETTTVVLTTGQGRAGVFKSDAKGGITLSLDPKVLPASKHQQFIKLVQEFLGK